MTSPNQQITFHEMGFNKTIDGKTYSMAFLRREETGMEVVAEAAVSMPHIVLYAGYVAHRINEPVLVRIHTDTIVVNPAIIDFVKQNENGEPLELEQPDPFENVAGIDKKLTDSDKADIQLLYDVVINEYVQRTPTARQPRTEP